MKSVFKTKKSISFFYFSCFYYNKNGHIKETYYYKYSKQTNQNFWDYFKDQIISLKLKI